MKTEYISQRGQLIRSFYTGIGKTALIYPAAFFVAAGMGIVGLGMIFYLRDYFYATSSQIGLFAATWSVLYSLGCFVLRPVFSRFLPRYTIMVSTFFAFIIILLMQYSRVLFLNFILYGLYGIAVSFFWPPLMGWLSSNIEGKQLTDTLSRFNISWGCGTIISPYAAGWLSKKAIELPMYVGSGLFLLTCILIIGAVLALPGVRNDKFTVGSDKTGKAKEEKASFHRYPAWISCFLTFVVIGVLISIFPVSAQQDLGMSKETIGLVLLMRALFATIGFIIIGRTSFWHFKCYPMLSGLIGMIALLIFLNFANSPFLIGIVLALIGLNMSFNYSNSLFHSVTGISNRTKGVAIHESLLSAGVIVGSTMGGIIYHNFSMSKVYLFCITLLLIGAVGQILLCSWNNRKIKYVS